MFCLQWLILCLHPRWLLGVWLASASAPLPVAAVLQDFRCSWTCYPQFWLCERLKACCLHSMEHNSTYRLACLPPLPKVSASIAYSICLQGLVMGFVLFGSLMSLDRGCGAPMLHSETACRPSEPGCLNCPCSAQSCEGGNASGSDSKPSEYWEKCGITVSPGTGGEQEVGGSCDIVATVTSSFSFVLWCQTLNKAIMSAHLFFLQFVRTERSPDPVLKSPHSLPSFSSIWAPRNPAQASFPSAHCLDPLTSSSSSPAPFRGLFNEHSALMLALSVLFFYFPKSTTKYLAFPCLSLFIENAHPYISLDTLT